MTASVAWFRRDLRTSDNHMWRAAIDAAAGDGVVPLFVLDDSLWRAAGANRRWFLTGCLAVLDERLGGNLVIRHGEPSDVVAQVATQVGATQVFHAQDANAVGRRRDQAVADALEQIDAELVEADSPYAVPPGTLTNKSGGPFKVYTPFSKSWFAHGVDPPVRAPSSFDVPDVPSDPLPDVPSVSAELPQPGEVAAKRALDRFLDRDADGYADARNSPGDDRTSRLSPYLHFGCIHPRQILGRLDLRKQGHRVYAQELAWRDFYADVLLHAPGSAWSSWNDSMASMEIDTGTRADERFEAWCQGRTGFPIVDAGMRQLAGEGWMHNRVRMITASFLVKDLHIDWTRGARFFLEHLVDGDVSSNNHGWQWVAGTGTDAAPYFRIFNPTSQSQRFDPDGTYIRRWIPELAEVDGRHVHEPSTGPDGLPAGYPHPIVDHAAERTEALARYDTVRAGR